MDESGTHDDSSVVCAGAYLALPTTWRDWTKKWNVKKHPIKVFHATDCQNLTGEFAGWSASERDSFVSNLLPVIADHKLAAWVVGINLNDFRDVTKTHPWIRDNLKTPYAACFQWTMQSILEWLIAQGDSRRLAFVHEVNDIKGEMADCFEWFSSHHENKNRKMTLVFGGKDDYVPLQAADVLAYEGNKRIRRINHPQRRAWIAINPEGRARTLMYFDKPSLIKFAERISVKFRA